MPTVVNYRFKLRRGLKANWVATNEVSFAGEMSWASDTGEIKVGDDSTPWNSLPYFERGVHLDRLGDVDASLKADGRVLAWNAALGKHKYVDQASGGGGGTNPMPNSVIHWLALRQRGGNTGDPTYFANSPVAGVGLNAAGANSSSVKFSEAVNGNLGARFNGVNYYVLSPAISLYNNTIIAVVKTPTTADWGTQSDNCIASNTVSGAPKITLARSGDSSSVRVDRSGQVVLFGDSAYGLIPPGTVICITVTISANNTMAIRRNGVQTATGSGASFTQPLATWGSRANNETAVGPLLELVVFDRVLSAAALTQAESYLMSVWGIV